MSDLADSEFPSSVAFQQIADSLSSEQAKKNALNSGGKGIFAFALKNKAGESKTWYIDLKKTATLGKGQAPQGERPDVTLSLSDEDFGKLVKGEAQGQKLFMSGKMKVKGDIMKATKADAVLKAVTTQPPKAKL